MFLGVTCWRFLVTCWTDPGTRMDVLVVADVPVSPSSVVTDFCDGASLGSDWIFSLPNAFVFGTDSQEEVR